MELTAQQLVPCIACIKEGRPCIIFLELTPTCVGCLKGKHSCSFVPNIGGNKVHVNLPYSGVIGKYFHLKQIALAMKGEPLFLAPQRITDINFSPGIPLGTKTSEYGKGTVGPAQDKAREQLAELAGTDWQQCWYGVPYDVASAAYTEIGESTGDERLWSITDIPTEDEVNLIEQFYHHFDELTTDGEWLAEDMMSIFPAEPTLNIIPTDEQTTGEGTPESEEGDLEDITARLPAQEVTREVGKANATFDNTSMDEGFVSQNQMDVDGEEPPPRERFLSEVEGKSRKGDLFEIPTRIDGKRIKRVP